MLTATAVAKETFVRSEHGAVVSTDAQCLAVDFSGRSGAILLMALTGIEPPDAKGKGGELLSVSRGESGGRQIEIVTMQEGKAPAVTFERNRAVVGKQTVAFDGKTITLGQ